MSNSTVQTIARILKVLVTVTFVCNLLALLLVPGLVMLPHTDSILADMEWSAQNTRGVLFFLPIGFIASWRSVWGDGAYSVVLTLFLLSCGICTAAILWQGRRVVSLRRAAVCSFVISLAALARLIFSLYWFRSPAPLVSYNALFVPIFAMFGLLCLVMAALFGQAAEIKAENDLTI